MSTLQTRPKMTETERTSIVGILATLFTTAVPCQVCGKRVPTYHDREKGSHYCLCCLEAAVEEAEAEWEAEWLTA